MIEFNAEVFTALGLFVGAIIANIGALKGKRAVTSQIQNYDKEYDKKLKKQAEQQQEMYDKIFDKMVDREVHHRIEIQTLRTDLENAQSEQRSVAESISTMQVQIAELQNTITRLTQDNQARDLKIQALSNENKSLKQQIEAVEKERNELIKKIEVNQAQIDELTDKEQTLKKELSKAEGLLKAKTQTLFIDPITGKIKAKVDGSSDAATDGQGDLTSKQLEIEEDQVIEEKTGGGAITQPLIPYSPKNDKK